MLRVISLFCLKFLFYITNPVVLSGLDSNLFDTINNVRGSSLVKIEYVEFWYLELENSLYSVE